MSTLAELVCLDLFLCFQNKSKHNGQILMKFSGNVDNDTRKRLFDFGVVQVIYFHMSSGPDVSL